MPVSPAPRGEAVAKKFNATLNVPAVPAVAFEQQCDAEYQRWKLEQMYGEDIVVEITPDSSGGATIVHSRSMQADVPSIAKRFVGESIRVTETHVWGPAEESGTRIGTIHVAIEGTPMTVNGKLALNGTVETAIVIAGEIKAGVPMIGGKLEEIVADVMMKAVDKESTLSGQWLSR
jgi:Protein of unknown function (DUF2505)